MSLMQQIDDLTYIEQEFEDLQRLIKQHLTALQEIDNVKTQLHTLNQFQEFIQTDSQNTAEILTQIEHNQRTLNDRTDELEAQLQQLSHEFAQLCQTLNQKWGDMDAWSQQQQSMVAEITGWETRIRDELVQEIERLGQANSASINRLDGLEMRFSKLYGSVKSTSGKMQNVLNGLFAVGLLGAPLLVFAILHFFS